MEDLERLGNVGWQNILQSYYTYPAGFRRAVPYLFASLVFHHDWLRENLSERHPLWNQPIFTHLRGINGNENVTLVNSLLGRVLG